MLIVDEHPLLRAGVRTLLEAEGRVQVVGEADSVDDGVVAVRRHQPDIVLIDIAESSADSVDAMRRLREEVPRGALVVLSRHDDDEDVYRAVVGGAAGLVGNDAHPDELVDTIHAAATGAEPISQTLVRRPEVGQRVLEGFAALRGRGAAQPTPRLNEREVRILDFAARGRTNQAIGRELGLSEHAIKAALSQLLGRLGLRHRTEAVAHAIREGWIIPSDPEPNGGDEVD